jgi:UDP-N-acetylglucosamine transferase subunit ALG13
LILVTVGGQLPFDRLIRCVDAWAARTGAGDVLAQIGGGAYEPQHLRWERYLPAARFREAMRSADAIVAHAGVGTILTALELRKPLLVFPRRADQREHRNDHQLGTARHFASRGLLLAAFSETELDEQLGRLREAKPGAPPSPAAPELIARIRGFALGANR